MTKETKPNGHAPEDTDIEITLDPAVEPEIKVAEQEDKPAVIEPPAPVAAEEGIETLKANLRASQDRERDERTARLAAEARANNAGKEVQDTNLALVTNAIATINQSQDTLEANMAQAATDGDWAAHAKLNRQMQANEAKLAQLENGKTALEAEAKNPRQPERRTSGDPVEDFISGVDITRQSADWLREHPDYVTNPAKNREMIAAHNLLMARGVRVDTPEYFSGVENVLGIVQQREEPREESALSEASEGTRRQSPAAAPVSRGGGMDGQKKPGTVRLSAAEVEMAAQMGQTPAEYAAEKVKLIAEGKMN